MSNIHSKDTSPELKLLHELNEKRRDIAEEVRGSAWDSPTRMHHTAKAAGMDKALWILGYEWKDNRYQRIEEG